jgi:hypothetical protein
MGTIGIAVLGLVLSCATLASGGGGAVRPRARLELKIAPKIGPLRDAHFEIVLRNTSGRSLWVNTRMALDAHPTTPGLSEIWLDIRGPAGAVEFNCKVRGGAPDESDYSVLKAGDAVTNDDKLRCFDDLRVGKTYTARAHYFDQNPEIPPAPDGAVHLSEEVVSAQVQFEVVAK